MMAIHVGHVHHRVTFTGPTASVKPIRSARQMPAGSLALLDFTKAATQTVGDLKDSLTPILPMPTLLEAPPVHFNMRELSDIVYHHHYLPKTAEAATLMHGVPGFSH